MAGTPRKYGRGKSCAGMLGVDARWKKTKRKAEKEMERNRRTDTEQI